MGKKIRQLILFIALSLCLAAQAWASEFVDEIKVGYVSNYGALKAAFTNGSEGYGFEYLNNLIQYMDGDFSLHFVSCDSWQDGLDKLDRGEIHLLGPTTIHQTAGYAHTEHDFGTCTFMLAELSNDNAAPVNTTALDGATIAIPDYYTDFTCLTDFLETEHIDANLVTIPSANLNLTLGLEDIDYIWMSSLQTHAGLTVVTGLDTYPVFFIASPENQWLIDQMDAGLEALAEAEPYFESQLALRYSSYNYTTNAYISEENLAIVQEKGTYRVGIRDFHSPLIRETDDGQLEGVGFTLLDMLSETAGITFEYIMLDESAPQSDFVSTDFVIAATDGTAEMGFPYNSSTYLDLPFMLLERRDSSDLDASQQRIGVANYYCAEKYMENNTLYGREMVKYPTVQELQEAFDAGEIDCMLITVVSLNMLRDDFNDQDYIATTVEDSLQLSLAFSERLSDEEITVFNKLISTVDQSALEAATLEYTLSSQETTLSGYWAEHPWVLVNIYFLIVIIGIVIAIISEYRRRTTLSKALNSDDLTGLPSQRKFIEDARRILKYSSHEPYNFVSLDIDNFKYINEMYGYEIGSQLLQLLASHIKAHLAPDALFARFTGDNFFLMVHAPASTASLARWKDLDEALQQEIEKTLHLACRINFSIGVYEIVNPDLDVSVMIDYANIARQSGKETTGFTCNYFTEKMAATRIINNEITTAMVPAIEKEEFLLYFQPKLSLCGEKLVGAEVLVRWLKNGKIIPPMDFLPLFEKNGFIKTLDYYVLRHTCLFLQIHRRDAIPRLSVNLSGVTMLYPRVVQDIQAIVTSYGIHPSQLDLEITETAFVESSIVVERMGALRNLGFTISMDDFGTGVSSLNRLKNMSLDTVKIDREFIIDSLENPRGNQILQAVVQLVQHLDLETVAEGIETEAQREFLKNLGCNVGQGYLFARPLPEKDFLAYFKSHT